MTPKVVGHSSTACEPNPGKELLYESAGTCTTTKQQHVVRVPTVTPTTNCSSSTAVLKSPPACALRDLLMNLLLHPELDLVLWARKGDIRDSVVNTGLPDSLTTCWLLVNLNFRFFVKICDTEVVFQPTRTNRWTDDVRLWSMITLHPPMPTAAAGDESSTTAAPQQQQAPSMQRRTQIGAPHTDLQSVMCIVMHLVARWNSKNTPPAGCFND
eukprot:Lankesteria_metandrocarpae@DN6172_c0_g1_i1.p1